MKGMHNLVKRGQVGSRDLLLKFGAFLHISETVRARNVKFGMQIYN